MLFQIFEKYLRLTILYIWHKERKWEKRLSILRNKRLLFKFFIISTAKTLTLKEKTLDVEIDDEVMLISRSLRSLSCKLANFCERANVVFWVSISARTRFMTICSNDVELNIVDAIRDCEFEMTFVNKNEVDDVDNERSLSKIIDDEVIERRKLCWARCVNLLTLVEMRCADISSSVYWLKCLIERAIEYAIEYAMKCAIECVVECAMKCVLNDFRDL